MSKPSEFTIWRNNELIARAGGNDVQFYGGDRKFKVFPRDELDPNKQFGKYKVIALIRDYVYTTGIRFRVVYRDRTRETRITDRPIPIDGNHQQFCDITGTKQTQIPCFETMEGGEWNPLDLSKVSHIIFPNRATWG